MKRGVFLDRDGVILREYLEEGEPRSARSLEEFEVLPRVCEALALLQQAGLELVVVTNQPEVARGRVSRNLVETFHERLRSQLSLEHIYACFHDDPDACGCRKPKPGMLKQASEDLGISLIDSFLVGDRWRDIEAGHRAGCRTFLIRQPYSGPSQADFEVGSLWEAAGRIVTLAGKSR